jgi:hypothetical protein
MDPRSHLSERTERATSGCIRKAFGPVPVIGKPWREQSSRGDLLGTLHRTLGICYTASRPAPLGFASRSSTNSSP